jgi:hypothetical protein
LVQADRESEIIKEREQYSERFIRFAERVERWLIRLIAASIFLLAISQLLLTNDAIRYRLSKVDRAEGVAIPTNWVEPRP